MKKLAQQEKKSWIVTAKQLRSEPVWILRIEIAAFSGVVSFWFHQICVLSGIRQKQTNRKPGDTPTDKKRMDNMTCCLLSELPGNRWRDLEQVERAGGERTWFSACIGGAVGAGRCAVYLSLQLQARPLLPSHSCSGCRQDGAWVRWGSFIANMIQSNLVTAHKTYVFSHLFTSPRLFGRFW